jgi:hypothetical protein
MNLQLPYKGDTFETVSQMIFTATRFENSALFKCKADNIVMRDERDRPLQESLNLEVMCKSLGMGNDLPDGKTRENLIPSHSPDSPSFSSTLKIIASCCFLP